MISPNFRAMHSAERRPEAPGATVAVLVPHKLGSALARQMPGRQVGCTMLLSLLLASCAYRQDAGPSVAHGGETATPESAHEAMSAGKGGSPSSPAIVHAERTPARRRGDASGTSHTTLHRDTASLPEAWNGLSPEDMPPPPDINASLDMSAADSSPPVPAPAAALLDIDRESVRHWVRLSPWYALPILLALGMPLIGIMGRRMPRRSPVRREPSVSLEDMPASEAGEILVDGIVTNIPMGVGAMAAPPWSPVSDPLSREDWRPETAVRYEPLTETRWNFVTRASYVLRIDAYTRAAKRCGDETDRLSPASAQGRDGEGEAVSPTAASPAHMEQAIVFASPAVHQPVIEEERLPANEAVVAMDAPALAEAILRTPLIERVEAILARTLPQERAVLDIEDGFPAIVVSDEAPLPAELLSELEAALLESHDPEGAQATWLLTQVLALRMARADKPEVDALHRAATALALHGERADGQSREHWRARRIELDLARAARQNGASRLLALRAMAAHHADALETGTAPVLKAWIRVLLYWARHQLGDSALARFADAAALAERLREVPGKADEGQLLLVDVLLRRAQVEHGGVRARTLAEAQRLAEASFARAPTGRAALAVAETALERGRHAQPRVAAEAFSHALAHAFIAGSDLRWHAASLRLRLAIQLAYESLPGMPVQGNVALELAQKLDRLPAPPADAIDSMALAFIRHGEYGQACRLCAEAWQAGARAPALLETWRLASAHWARGLASPRSRSEWQDNERLRRVANQMQ